MDEKYPDTMECVKQILPLSKGGCGNFLIKMHFFLLLLVRNDQFTGSCVKYGRIVDLLAALLLYLPPAQFVFFKEALSSVTSFEITVTVSTIPKGSFPGLNVLIKYLLSR